MHRVPGGKRQAVFAYRAEIDDWMHGKTTVAASSPIVAVANVSSSVPESTEVGALESRSTYKARILKYSGLAIIVLIPLVSAAVLFRFLAPGSSVQITKVTRLSGDALFKSRLATDGVTLYFSELAGGKMQLSRMPVNGGPISHIALPSSNADLQEVSADGRGLLVTGRDGREEEASLWIVPVDGGPPRRVGNVLCHSAALSPDGKAIAYARGNSIFITFDYGATSLELRHLEYNPIDLHWSRSGNRLRFVSLNFAAMDMMDRKVWEIEFGDRFNVLAINRVPSTPGNCCLGSVQTPDYDFFATRGNKPESRMWAVAQHRRWWQPTRAESIDLPTPLSALSALASDERTGRLFAIVEEPNRGEFVRFVPFSGTFRPFLPGISGLYPDFSRDGKWIAYVGTDEGPLWIARAESDDPRQLTSSFEKLELPRWSPDGTQIAFTAKNHGRPWRIYVISRGGGTPREVSSGEENQGAPTWSPDGKWLAYANVWCRGAQECAVHLIELATGKIETLPGSGGLRTARWSPDGRYIAALNGERHQLLVFDVSRKSWRKLSDSIMGDDLSWAHDSRYLFAKSSIGDKPRILRIPVPGGNPESVVDLESLSKLTGRIDDGLCVAPDDSIILHRQISSSEIYAVDWTLR